MPVYKSNYKLLFCGYALRSYFYHSSADKFDKLVLFETLSKVQGLLAHLLAVVIDYSSVFVLVV